MYIIDSDILVSELLIKYDPDDTTKKYLTFYKKIPLMKRVIPDFIVNEFELYINYVMPARYSMEMPEKNQLHDVVTSYLRQIVSNCTLVSVSPQIMKTAVALYQQRPDDQNGQQRITFTDCLLLAAAHQFAYTIVSKDPQIHLRAAELHIPYFVPKM
jgi:hypothetical protein